MRVADPKRGPQKGPRYPAATPERPEQARSLSAAALGAGADVETHSLLQHTSLGASPTSSPVFEVWQYPRWERTPRMRAQQLNAPVAAARGPVWCWEPGQDPPGPTSSLLAPRGAAGGSAWRAGRSSAGDTWKSSAVATGRDEPGVQEGRREGERYGDSIAGAASTWGETSAVKHLRPGLATAPPRERRQVRRRWEGGEGRKKKKKSLTRQI